MATARINDTDLYYETHGDGPPLLLVHGLGSSSADWAFQVPDLKEHFHLVLPDLRGSGLSEKPTGPYRIAQFAEDLWGLADHLGISDIRLAGFSLGGAVALEMALMRPEACDRLVLINALPSYRVDHWKKWLESHGHIWMIRLLGLRRTASMVAKRLFPGDHQLAMRQRVVDVVGNNPRRAYLDTVRALVGWCAADRLEQLQADSLMLTAEMDYTGLEEKQKWARRLGAELVIVEGSRHGTPFDSIQATNACLRAFLSDHDEPLPDLPRVDSPEQTPTEAPVY